MRGILLQATKSSYSQELRLRYPAPAQVPPSQREDRPGLAAPEQLRVMWRGMGDGGWRGPVYCLPWLLKALCPRNSIQETAFMPHLAV